MFALNLFCKIWRETGSQEDSFPVESKLENYHEEIVRHILTKSILDKNTRW